MEFLAIISTVIAAASKGLGIAWYRWSARKEAQRQLKECHEALMSAVVSEGRRIRTYIEFDRLINEIDGAIEVILQSHKRNAEDEAFWDNIEPTHRQLQQVVCVRLQNFDNMDFNDYHQGLVSAARPGVEQYIQESNALFDTRQREAYVNRLFLARPQIGRMKGFGDMIIEGVSNSLLGYR